MTMHEGQRICPRCGKAQHPARQIRCRHCGMVNRSTGNTCAFCGLSLRRIPGWALLAAIPALAALLAVVGWVVLPGLLAGPGPTDMPPAAPTQAVAAVTADLATSTVATADLATSTVAPTMEPTRTSLPAPTSTSPAPTSTSSPTVAPTSTPTSTPTATESPTPTSTPSPTPTSTPTATATDTPEPTPTLEPTETPTAEALPSAEASPTPFIYVVKSGDNLYTIAQNFGVTVDDIMEANNLTSNRLRVGQTLIIPLSTPTPSPTPEP